MAVEPDIELLTHLADPEAWVTLKGEGFHVDLIEDERVSEAFEWAKEFIRKHGEPPTAEVLDDEFEFEGEPFFDEPVTVIEDLVDRMRGRYKNNQQRERIKKLAKLQKEDPDAVSKEMGQSAKELREILTRRGESYSAGEGDRALQAYLDKATKGPGPSLGFKVLDGYFSGQRGITTIAAAPKSYKSWFVVKAVLENAFQGKYPWLYSLELPAEETEMRLMCMMAGIPWSHYIHNSFTREEQTVLVEMETVLAEAGAYKVVTPSHGERTIEEMIGNAQDAGAGAIFIDQAQYVEMEGKKLGDWNETGKYWAVLDQARSLTDDICFVHQLNSAKAANSDTFPTFDMLKSTSAFVEVGTLVLGLWASKEMRKSSKMQIGVISARNHTNVIWDVDVKLTDDCDFEIIGVAEDDDE